MLLPLPGASGALRTGWAGIWGGQGLPNPPPSLWPPSSHRTKPVSKESVFFTAVGMCMRKPLPSCMLTYRLHTYACEKQKCLDLCR